ncbi:hypothetical protein HDU76_012077, partial [Blyttiomyces sp. JEL0837]
EDDLLIRKEGVESLEDWEVRKALEDRGISTTGNRDPTHLRSELEAWLDVSLNDVTQIPDVLLAITTIVRTNLNNGSIKQVSQQ